MQWVWRYSRSQNAARLVLLAIADCCHNDDGTGAWPSNAELQDKTQLSERAVQTAIKGLERSGELKVEYGGGRRGVNRYTVLMGADYPAGSAPFGETPQDLHPAESAVGQTEEAPQVNGTNPAGSAGDEDSAPPADSARNPAGSAPGTVKNRKTKTSSSKRSRPRVADIERPDVEEICAYLADKIQANGSKRPTITQGWRDAGRRLIDLDGRTVEQIRKAIDWSQNDEFWRGNILSMPTLREQYDRLRLAAQRKARGSPGDKPGYGRNYDPNQTYTEEIPE